MGLLNKWEFRQVRFWLGVGPFKLGSPLPRFNQENRAKHVVWAASTRISNMEQTAKRQHTVLRNTTISQSVCKTPTARKQK